MSAMNCFEGLKKFPVLHGGIICNFTILSIPHTFIYSDKWRCPMTEREGYMFERKFLEIVEEVRRKKGISKKAFASMVFTQEKDPNKKYHMLLNGDSNAKPQRLKHGEAFEISRQLQVSFDLLNQEAERRLTFD